jgi:hypothetical protein
VDYRHGRLVHLERSGFAVVMADRGEGLALVRELRPAAVTWTLNSVRSDRSSKSVGRPQQRLHRVSEHHHPLQATGTRTCVAISKPLASLQLRRTAKTDSRATCRPRLKWIPSRGGREF